MLTPNDPALKVLVSDGRKRCQPPVTLRSGKGLRPTFRAATYPRNFHQAPTSLRLPPKVYFPQSGLTRSPSTAVIPSSAGQIPLPSRSRGLEPAPCPCPPP